MTAIHTRLATDKKYSCRVSGMMRKNTTATAATVHRAIGSGYSPISASYVVFSTPHSLWITCVSTRRARGGGVGWGLSGPRGTRSHFPYRLGSIPAHSARLSLGGNGSRQTPPHPAPTGSTHAARTHDLGRIPKRDPCASWAAWSVGPKPNRRRVGGRRFELV